jgi:hypothetical protein
MRWIIITAAVCLMAWSNTDARTWIENLIEEPADPHVAAAIEVRCASEEGAFREECALDLQRDFELGVREPESILRLHCTRVPSDWAQRARTADSICERIYGGWIES